MIAPAKKPTNLQAMLLMFMTRPDAPLVMRWRAKYYAHDAEVYYGSISGCRKTVKRRTFEAMLEAGWIEPFRPEDGGRGASYYRLTELGHKIGSGK